ncbi:transposase [Geoalkalibacter halelectricus]|uniref:Transposase n=1 Tax=Geoalkalibacter halelectricus TaxID=2847045 RepID=A0ABY5ZL41_9BACT|nr:transposase [Geoalkalibacter halelectricus]UWZ79788.1 transposase [Geoalkalibacter halelectricus]
MPRANRHYVPGYIWHITHRCHKKEFLLKFAHDRNRFVFWLGEARKRYRLQILNYVVTSNHVHLLVRDQGATNCIPSAMQLLAGRTGQEYNQRKERKGAFWERIKGKKVCGRHQSRGASRSFGLQQKRVAKVY